MKLANKTDCDYPWCRGSMGKSAAVLFASEGAKVALFLASDTASFATGTPSLLMEVGRLALCEYHW